VLEDKIDELEHLDKKKRKYKRNMRNLWDAPKNQTYKSWTEKEKRCKLIFSIFLKYIQ
jgi:hypothetical protein